MVGTVVYIRVNADNRESAQDTGLHGLLDTFADRRDILLRDRAADDGGLELVYFLRRRTAGSRAR